MFASSAKTVDQLVTELHVSADEAKYLIDARARSLIIWERKRAEKAAVLRKRLAWLEDSDAAGNYRPVIQRLTQQITQLEEAN